MDPLLPKSNFANPDPNPSPHLYSLILALALALAIGTEGPKQRRIFFRGVPNLILPKQWAQMWRRLCVDTDPSIISVTYMQRRIVTSWGGQGSSGSAARSGCFHPCKTQSGTLSTSQFWWGKNIIIVLSSEMAANVYTSHRAWPD